MKIENFKIAETSLAGVLIIEPKVFSDERGTFFEAFSERDFIPCGTHRFVQENQSTSRRGVVRGLHFQKEPHAQAKLVRVAAGRILDVALDMRRTGPDGRPNGNFGKWVAVELSDENRRQMFIPRGFAHGFSVLSDSATVVYKCDDYYAPEAEAGVLWNDAALGIDWGLEPSEAIISEKDGTWPTFEQLKINN